MKISKNAIVVILVLSFFKLDHLDSMEMVDSNIDFSFQSYALKDKLDCVTDPLTLDDLRSRGLKYREAQPLRFSQLQDLISLGTFPKEKVCNPALLSEDVQKLLPSNIIDCQSDKEVLVFLCQKYGELNELYYFRKCTGQIIRAFPYFPFEIETFDIYPDQFDELKIVIKYRDGNAFSKVAWCSSLFTNSDLYCEDDTVADIQFYDRDMYVIRRDKVEGYGLVFKKYSREESGEMLLYSQSMDAKEKIKFEVAELVPQVFCMITNPIDGLEIPTIVLFPHGIQKDERIPLYIDLHGGPRMHRSGDLSLFQYIVNKLKVCVALPNYRGSDGYGRKLMNKLKGEMGLGKNLNNDVMAVVKWMSFCPMIDSERVILGGGSFGAYLTLSIAVSEYGKDFKGFVGCFGSYDWTKTLEAEEKNSTKKEISDELSIYWGINDPRDDPDTQANISPILHLPNLKNHSYSYENKPRVLLINGQEEGFSPVEQKKKIELIFQDDETLNSLIQMEVIEDIGHGPKEGSSFTLEDLFNRIEDFIRSHT